MQTFRDQEDLLPYFKALAYIALERKLGTQKVDSGSFVIRGKYLKAIEAALLEGVKTYSHGPTERAKTRDLWGVLKERKTVLANDCMNNYCQKLQSSSKEHEEAYLEVRIETSPLVHHITVADIQLVAPTTTWRRL